MSSAAVRWTGYARMLRPKAGLSRCRRETTAKFVASPLLSSSSTSSSSVYHAARFRPSLCSPHASCRYFSNKYKDGEDSGDDSDWDDDVEVPSFNKEVIRSLIPTKPETAKTAMNEALQSVIDSGLDELKATSSIIANKKETRKPLFHKGAIEGETVGPTKQQLAEAERIQSVASECLEKLQRKNKEKKHALQIGGYSIMVVHVEVNSNLREATVLWALPFEILCEANEKTRQELVARMQHQMTEGGGGRVLQGEVHRVLSHYYPPKLKFKPADDGILQQMMIL